MFSHLEVLIGRYEELQRQIADPVLLSQPLLWQKAMKERAELSPIIEAYEQYRSACVQEEESLALLHAERDPMMIELIREELSEARTRQNALEHQIHLLLLPKDPNDEKNVFLEIRAGIGGEEAALFAVDLLRMYTRYAEHKGWKSSVVSVSESELGGIKEIVLSITGKGAYSRLKYESGVHRVQRVPVTESGGRIHTSTATVAVMPEVEDVEIEIDPNDIRIDVFRSSGNGGQCVNTTDSAVRITHYPTGIVVSCQDEKSQIQNRAKGLRVLRARLYEKKLAEQKEKSASERRAQVGSGDRSEKIRTYNFPQTRITDHRIHYTVYRMDGILSGELDEMIDLLNAAEQAEKLASQSE